MGGGGVTVLTDHKPLVSINQNSLSKAPKRLQNLHLCAQQYSYTLRYKPRKEIPRSDMLSQAPANKPEMEELLPVNNLMMQPIQDHRLSQICYNTEQGHTMRALAEIITRGWPDNMKVLLDSLKLFFNYRDELTVQDGLILRGQRIVIPLSMQPKMQPSTCWPPRYTHVFKG